MKLPENSYIVLQAYGNKSILQECVFALLSLSRNNPENTLSNLEVWIYTDQPDFFKEFKDIPFPVFCREMNQELIRDWKGATDFVHRVKIEILRDFVKNRNGQVLYLDTDICFAMPVFPLFENIRKGEKYMHVMEGKVHESPNIVFRKLSGFLKSHSLNVENQTVTIPPDVAMWNAGVLGFHTNEKALLEKILLFTDKLHSLFPKHIAEQFAFSLYFQTSGKILTAHPYIYHYWNLKELRPVLNSFFAHFSNKSWEALSWYSQLIQLPDFLQQKANFYQSRSLLEKALKKEWKPEIPDWSLLTDQL